MSLKAFHVFFVVMGILILAGFGVWAARDYRLNHETGSLAMSALSFVLAAALVGYGRWFLKKLRNVRFI